ncbi:MAG TPA: valine--tRNA ligase [Thermomicrobiales bacterium]|jgi:valyl-tRNA synthetase|nr:valine--tRNA ligase [Thermomicrobiales bacterium]
MTETGTTTESQELSKSYDPTSVERGMYDGWDAAGYFAPQDGVGRAEGDHPPFVMVMPPPNLTGELHVGHAMFVTLEDIMARWNRMMGRPTLWLPGADHAGIAGQWVVERQLAREGLTRHDLGREAFLERVWAFMDSSRGRVREQMRILGASTDWSRFAFTMDEGPSRAVRTVFKRLHDKGLIYRGTRLISWCPRCRTALSDLEVVYRDEDSFLWTLRYAVEGEPGRMVEVATSRPETFFGDTAVAVHPDDERYGDLVGRNVILPIIGRSIPVVADAHVDPAFGTGAVKVTPAHDPNDYEIGQRHDLPQITVMNLDGTMNAEAGPFEGMAIREAREAVVARLQADGALGEVRPHSHSVGHCDRCGTVVEPMISKQWFLAMEGLAQPALQAAYDGSLTFVPERHKGIYTNWLENIHDWCISRQLWWGHRIPVWYCEAPGCSETIVSDAETVESCPSCGGTVRQDPDVLDTWFSSGLWPFSTLGWPDQTDDLRRFYPGSVMETGYDIIFLWVSRMVFFGLEIMGELPFHTVYLHGLVRDAEGAKMSKTKGNVVDPIAMSEQYGADALRFALMTAGSPANDIKIGPQRVEMARNFGNKLWNATRFALGAIRESGATVRVDDDGPVRPTAEAYGLTVTDRWILSRLDATTASVTQQLENYQFGEAARQLQDFTWSELCDWYIEAAKVRLRGTEDERACVAQTLAFVLERSVRLLHPFMPFLTESLWQALPHRGESIMISAWPAAGEPDTAAVATFDTLCELVRGIRNARVESGVEAGRWIEARVFAGPQAAALEEVRRELATLARVSLDTLVISAEEPHAVEQSITVVAGDVSAALPLAGMIDLDAERDRLRKEIGEAEAERTRANAQLGNEAFVARAPEKVIEVQRKRLATAEEQVAVLTRRLAELG